MIESRHDRGDVGICERYGFGNVLRVGWGLSFHGGSSVRPGLGANFLRVCMASAVLTWLACADDNVSPLSPTPVAPNAARNASGSQATPSAPASGGSSLLSAPGVASHGAFHPSGPRGAGSDAGGDAAAAAVAALDVPPGFSGPRSAGPDYGIGLARPPSTESHIASDLTARPEAGLERAFDSPETPLAEVNHGDGSATGADAAELKSTAPMPIEPVDEVVIVDSRPVLAASNAQGLFVGAAFEYRFVLYKVVGNSRMEVEDGSGAPRGANSTSYQVTRPLDLQASYVWRARAFLDGAYGPWSEDASFRTTAVRLGVPRPLLPQDGATVPIDTSFTVRNPTVEGSASGAFIEIQVATDAGFTSNVRTGRTRMRDGRDTDVALSRALLPSTRYYWRARATASARSAGQVAGSWSDAVSFRTSAFRLTAPQPIAPRNGAVDVPIRPRPSNPQFTVRNATASAGAGSVNVQLQVAEDQAFANIVARGETHQRARGRTDIWIGRALMPDTRYFWRVRARLAADPAAVSAWSAVWRFTTGGMDDTGATTAPGQGNCCPPPNRFDIVQAVIGRTGNLYRQDIQQFTQRVAECLATTDGDWGRRRNDSGAVGKDTVAYRTSRGPGSGPFSIDIMLGAESGDPRPHWAVQSHDGIEGRVGGSWLAVDGSNCILGNVSAR